MPWTSRGGTQPSVNRLPFSPMKPLGNPAPSACQDGKYCKAEILPLHQWHVKALDATIGAWVPGGPGGTLVKSLLLGVSGLRYIGSVGTGFSQAERRALAALLRRLAAPTSPFGEPLRAGLERGEVVRFVRPHVRGEVEYAHFTAHSHLRHPVWKGLRGDYQE